MDIEFGLKPGEWPGRPVSGNDETSVDRLAVVAPSADLRIGVVGCGYWGARHVRVLSSLSAVSHVALIDWNPNARAPLCAAFPAVSAFSDLESALPHVDAVVIATPPRSHSALALQALHAGKHVLVEKPLATSVAEAHALVTEASKAHRVLMVGHTFEFNAAVRELGRRLDRGELGEIYYIHSARLSLGLYQQDVNVIWDLAPHDVSILNYLLRSSPTRVTTWGSTNAQAGIEDLAYIRLDYRDLGVTGYIHVSWLDPRKVRQVTVVGSDKMAIYNEQDTEERLRIFDRGIGSQDGDSARFGWPLSYRLGDIISPHIHFNEPLAVEDRHFVDCIREGRAPDADGWNGLAVVETLEAAERSLRTGTSVAVERTEPYVSRPASLSVASSAQ
jgi:predicted dehydrogenase